MYIEMHVEYGIEEHYTELKEVRNTGEFKCSSSSSRRFFYTCTNSITFAIYILVIPRIMPRVLTRVCIYVRIHLSIYLNFYARTNPSLIFSRHFSSDKITTRRTKHVGKSSPVEK